MVPFNSTRGLRHVPAHAAGPRRGPAVHAAASRVHASLRTHRLHSGPSGAAATRASTRRAAFSSWHGANFAASVAASFVARKTLWPSSRALALWPAEIRSAVPDMLALTSRNNGPHQDGAHSFSVDGRDPWFDAANFAVSYYCTVHDYHRAIKKRGWWKAKRRTRVWLHAKVDKPSIFYFASVTKENRAR